MTIEHTAYIGTSKFELVKSVKELWKIIDENQLLPNNETNPERTPERTRDPNALVIGVYFPPLPANGIALTAELRKRQRHKAQLRMTAFRISKANCKTQQSKETFSDAMTK